MISPLLIYCYAGMTPGPKVASRMEPRIKRLQLGRTAEDLVLRIEGRGFFDHFDVSDGGESGI